MLHRILLRSLDRPSFGTILKTENRTLVAVRPPPAGGFRPDFSSAEPLRTLGLTEREAEVLLWVAQGKSNGDVATILGMSEKTVKQHLGVVFQKLGVESRSAATLRALEVLASDPKPKL